MMAMFYGCSSLTKLDLSSFDTSSVTRMDSMFYGCSRLTELDLSSFDTSSVTTMEFMFSGCTRLTELDLSGFDTSNVTTGYRMFYSVGSLSTILLNRKFKFNNVDGIMDLVGMYAWQEKNNMLFFSSDDMMSFHDESNESNTYRKVAYFEMTMDAMGGGFEDGSGKSVQRKVVDDSWEEVVPEKEGYHFDGWYIDREYANKFDFTLPVNKSITIYAKWSEEYVVNIPAKISLNSEDTLEVSAINNGEKTLEVNLKNDSDDINSESQLLLSNKKDSNVKAMAQLSWEPMNGQSKWNVLTAPPAGNEIWTESNILVTKPKNAQAGSYEGTITFEITYK